MNIRLELAAGIALAWAMAHANDQAPARFTETQLSEHQVKAAYLLNFTKFVEWPDSAFEAPDAPLRICIHGDDPFGATLDTLVEGEVVAGHRLAVVRLRRPPEPRACQVLYLGPGEGDAATTLRVLGRHVLTVGEGEAFLRAGGMIAFVVADRRVRFSINLPAANRSELRLSSKLLSVAAQVRK